RRPDPHRQSSSSPESAPLQPADHNADGEAAAGGRRLHHADLNRHSDDLTKNFSVDPPRPLAKLRRRGRNTPSNETEMPMQALFIGQTYIDVTFITDHMPTGDEKHVASAYAVSFGGNAVTAAFCCAKLGIVPDLIATVANDWLGRMFQDMCAKYGISIHPRKVATSSLSFIMPKDGKRAIVRCRDDEHIHPFPHLNLTGCRA